MYENDLVKAAFKVRSRVHAPYSKFSVCAALLAEAGNIFTGCNVENASFGLTICAERSAVAAAIAEGKKDFATIVVVSDSDAPASPCGACRQVLAEFNPEIKIVASLISGDMQKFNLS